MKYSGNIPAEEMRFVLCNLPGGVAEKEVMHCVLSQISFYTFQYFLFLLPIEIEAFSFLANVQH